MGEGERETHPRSMQICIKGHTLFHTHDAKHAARSRASSFRALLCLNYVFDAERAPQSATIPHRLAAPRSRPRAGDSRSPSLA